MKAETAMIAIDALDALSRQRALTEVESWNLERLIRHQQATGGGRARLSAWRRDGLTLAVHIPELRRALRTGKRVLAHAERQPA